MNELFAQMLPGASIIAVASAAGLVLARRWGGEAHEGAAKDDLDERLGHLLAHLRDLDEQQHRLTPESYTSERSRIEAQAAALMRQRERAEATPARQKKVEAPAAADPIIGFFGRHPEWKGALWGGGLVAILGFLYITVVAEQRPREPGGSLTGGGAPMMGGGAPAMGGGGQASMDPEVQALLQRLREAPTDITALVRLGHVVLRAQMLEEARVLTERALQLDPDNLEARVHDAVVVASQDPARGKQKLEAVLQMDPKLAEAWLFRGMMAMQSGDQAVMRESFSQFVTHAPEGPQRDRIKAMLDGMAAAPTP